MERETLKALLAEGLSLDAISDRVDRSPSTVKYWLDKHGLVANGSQRFGQRVDISLEVLEQMVADGNSAPQIARRLGCRPEVVRRRMARLGLHSRRERNRSIARAALAAGERFAVLDCPRHGQVRHVLESDRSHRCAQCNSERVAERRRRVKRLLIDEAGGACIACGYSSCEAALQFHHLDPSAKGFALSLRGITRSLERLRAEAAKCVLLCANCHAEVGSGFTTLPD